MAKITIPIITLSQNELDKMHWGEKHRLNKSIRAHLEGAIHDMGMTVNKMKKPKKRQVFIYSYRKRLIKDEENFRSGCKGLIDQLKNLGLIWDDDPKHMVANYFQLQHPEQKTEIFISDESKGGHHDL